MSKVAWGKPFPVKTISREEIVTAGFPRWQVAGLSDEEMVKIASILEVSYTDGFFSEDLEAAVNFVLRARPPRKNIIGEPV